MKTLLLVILLLISNAANAQASRDTVNIYTQCLVKHIEYIQLLTKDNPSNKLDSIYVQQDDYTTAELPTQINSIYVKVLSMEEVYRLTKNRNGIYLIAIRPARWQNNQLQIHVIDFSVSRKRKHYYFDNGGGSSFRVTCNKTQDYLIAEVIRQGGI